MPQTNASRAHNLNWRIVFKRTIHILGIILAVIVGAILAILLYGQFKPLHLAELQVNPQPIRDYAEADVAAKQLIAQDTTDTSLNPDCPTRYMSQGKKTEHVLVIRHGLTNCPRQFDELAQKYYQLGYTVIISRIPKHGIADRKTPIVKNLTAQEALQSFSHDIDIAQGLGEKVDIMGLSVSGNEVAEMAVQRDDIIQATMIDPFFGYIYVPAFLTRASAGAILTLPNVFIWWNSKLKENLPGPTNAYYGFYSHVVGQYLRMTFDVDRPLKAKQTIVITNANDGAVNNNVTNGLVAKWHRYGAVNVTAYEFPKSDGLNHDMIDPLQPDANIGIAYPKILELTTGQ